MDNLVEFLIWTFTLLGLTTIITKSYIFQKFRDISTNINFFLGKMMTCPPCFGFWGGAILSVFFQSITGSIFLDAILGSGLMFYITKCKSCGD